MPQNRKKKKPWNWNLYLIWFNLKKLNVNYTKIFSYNLLKCWLTIGCKVCSFLCEKNIHIKRTTFPSKKKNFIIEKETSQNNNKKALDQCWRKNNLWNWSTVTADREYNAYL